VGGGGGGWGGEFGGELNWWWVFVELDWVNWVGG
jgi:hypothetical protein